MNVRKITVDDFQHTHRIINNAYPVFNLGYDQAEKWFNKLLKDNDKSEFWGVFREDLQVACFITYDYEVNFRGTFIEAGGIGMVAVDLLHKKEKVCKHIIEFFHKYYTEKNAELLVLYPFRADFYKKMGFGFGSMQYNYVIPPSRFGRYESHCEINFADANNSKEITDFYNREIASKQNGAFKKQEKEFNKWINSPQMRFVTFKKDGDIIAYIVFKFSKSSQPSNLSYNFQVKEYQYKSIEGWQEISTFLNKQSDQVKYIEIASFDKDFYHYFDNPADDSDTMFDPVYHQSAKAGIGLMYKFLNPLQIFKKHANRIFTKSNLTLVFDITDNFSCKHERFKLTSDHNSIIFEIDDNNVDLRLETDISTISSILMGSLSTESAVKMNLVRIKNIKHIDCVELPFKTIATPVSYNWF